MSSSDENTLEITTEDLEIRIRGDEEDVARAYRALRGVVLDVDEVDDADDTGDPEAPNPDRPGGDTQPMHETAAEVDANDENDGAETDVDDQMSAAVRALTPDGDSRDAGAFIQLILRRARYHKVHLLERREFADSFLGRSLDPTHVSRIYTDTRTEERLRSRIEFGDTVWRELTEQGRAEVEGELSESFERAGAEESSDG